MLSFWCDPVFNNPWVKDLYKNYLLGAGHCPVCDDFIFINIKLIDGYYKVEKECINHDCIYNENISEVFNQHLGLNKPTEQTKQLNNTNNNIYTCSKIGIKKVSK